MKATKKIVGAACALVAAVALSAGSTFAWFAQSGKATASGMKVQTVVPTNLYIADGVKTAESDFTASTITFAQSTAQTLSPVTLVDASGTLTANVPKETTDGSQWTTAPTVGTAGTVAADGYVSVGTITTADGAKGVGSKNIGEYVCVWQMSLMNKGEADTADITLDATAKVTTSATSTTTLNFLKCGLLVGSTWTSMPITNALDWESGNQYKFGSAVSNLAVNTAQTVTLVVWYEGTDENCYSNNALSTQEMSIELVFEAQVPSGS